MSSDAMLLPALEDPSDRLAVAFGSRDCTYRQLAAASAAVAGHLAEGERVAVWATPSLETCAAVVGVVRAGAVAVPVNPRIGSGELEHVLRDAGPRRVVAPPGEALPPPLAALERVPVDVDTRAPAGSGRRPRGDDETPVLLFYTSGTTGPPKGVVVPRRAVESNLDALAAVWEWRSDDVLTHGLPLFHVHGLVLGVLGPLRCGGAVRHVGRFSAAAVAGELAGGATMLFGVPTMYRDLADAAEEDAVVGAALGRARLLVSGSAALPIREHERIERVCGRGVLERYGLTETLMNCAVPASGPRRPGSVGPPLPGVEVRVVDEESGASGDGGDGMGEVQVRGPNLFLGYLNRPESTAAAVRDGWFATGDLAVRDEEGWLRILGRRATDLIKTGGFKVGAGEVEDALLRHEAVAEAAVTGEPDDRLGQRIVAWVVLKPGAAVRAEDLADLVASRLAPHKRPREVRFRPSLPRNEMGKVTKAALRGGA